MLKLAGQQVVGFGGRPQDEPSPLNWPPTRAQSDAVTGVQAPERQHAPEAKQGLGEQIPPTVQGPEQELWSAMVQSPAGEQQEPSGAHGLNWQAPASVQTPAHTDCGPTEHAPAAEQQRPEGTQGFGVQVAFTVQVPVHAL